MHLRSYLKERKLRQNAFAAKARISPSHVNELLKGKKWPSRESWQRIFEATDGQVTPNDHLFPVREEPANGETTGGRSGNAATRP